MKAVHLTLISHATTEAQRSGRFHDDCDPLLEAALQPLELPSTAQVLSAPERRALQTAQLLALQPVLEPALRDCDLGRWRGRSLKGLQRDEPALLQAWLSDPGCAPHGGESVAELCQRVASWLEAFSVPGHWVGVTHPMVIRAAMMHVLQCPLQAFHHIDVQPLARLHLSHFGRWRVKLAAGG